MGNEIPEKKELAAGLQKFTLEILARLMKSLPNLEGHYDTLKESAISPTGDNLLKLYDIRKALKGEPIESHAEIQVPYGPSYQVYLKEDFPIVNFTQSFMNFVKASKVTGSWKNPLVIDFFEKFALLLDKESDLKADFILRAYSHFHLLEEQLARPTFPGIHELVDKAKKSLGLLPLTSKLYDIYLLSTEVEIALDRLDTTLPAGSIPAAESLDTMFAPIRLLCFTDMTSPNTRIFYRGKFIPESDLTKILTILSEAFVRGSWKNYSIVNFLNSINHLELDFRQMLLFIIDQQIPGFRKLMKHFKPSYVPAKPPTTPSDTKDELHKDKEEDLKDLDKLQKDKEKDSKDLDQSPKDKEDLKDLDQLQEDIGKVLKDLDQLQKEGHEIETLKKNNELFTEKSILETKLDSYKLKDSVESVVETIPNKEKNQEQLPNDKNQILSTKEKNLEVNTKPRGQKTKPRGRRSISRVQKRKSKGHGSITRGQKTEPKGQRKK